MSRSAHILPVIIISQFCCTSMWFAGNGVMSDLIASYSLDQSALGHLTSSVQLGFITGTLTFAVLTIADRFSPSRVFLTCAILGALFNLTIVWEGNTLFTLTALRFLTGFFLAGIYPVGMKIAADYFDGGLGRALGYLVGALVLGTASPHLLKDLMATFQWTLVIKVISMLATVGGLLMINLVPDGPYRKASSEFDFRAFFKVFQNRQFKSAAFGYFGHMWELYTFWAFVPLMLALYSAEHDLTEFNISVYSFLVIGSGGLSCVVGGYLAESFGTKKVAQFALTLSGLCCLISPFMFGTSVSIFLTFLTFWGMVVIADSPLFSTLVAQNADPKIKGTALTIVNSIGFSITIVSIQLTSSLIDHTANSTVFTLLALGPIFGLFHLIKK